MRTAIILRAVGALALVVFSGAYVSQAGTIATFADPVPFGSNGQLFELANDMLTGGWQGSGLNLATPITSQVFPNATFTITALTVDGAGLTDDGAIEFHEQAADGGDLILRITFDQARVYAPFGFGGSSLVLNQTVQFSGPIVIYPLDREMFSFSFANQQDTPAGATWTAAFTSSAIPEPGSLGLFGVALLALLRRR
jgi:hypothetical protein